MSRTESTTAVVVLPSGAAKRLIARGTAALPQVQRAAGHGLLVVNLGTTNAYLAEEILGQPVDPQKFCAGYVGSGLEAVPAERRGAPLVLLDGRPTQLGMDDVLARMGRDDVLVKGANAIDPAGVCGVFMASETGGTVGKLCAAALARGVEIVIPISVAKSVHTSVAWLSTQMGTRRLAHASGLSVGLYPLVGTAVTEVVAVELLYGVCAYHVAGGGVGPGRGGVVLLLEGEKISVDRAFQDLQRLAESEPPEPGFDADVGPTG